MLVQACFMAENSRIQFHHCRGAVKLVKAFLMKGTEVPNPRRSRLSHACHTHFFFFFFFL